jgi:hypothetical protein
MEQVAWNKSSLMQNTQTFKIKIKTESIFIQKYLKCQAGMLG